MVVPEKEKDMNPKDATEIIDDIKKHLVYWCEMGIKEISPPQRSFHSMKEVRNWLGDCQRCCLTETRKNIVFGTGSERSPLVFVGEGPGFDEDVQGEPFVGKAGQLLTKIIEAMGLNRKDVYIANVVKCRPPQNRNPHRDEIGACLPFLKEQLNIIRPKVICALGTIAAQALIGTEEKITKLRGNFHTYSFSTGTEEKALVMPTYHPAYLLRNPQEKKVVWRDMQRIMEELRMLKKP